MNKQTITPGVYGIAPVELCQDPRIAFNDMRTYISLASYQGTDPDSFPGREKIAERAGISVQAVSRSTARLESFGWIEKTRRFGRTTIYRCKVPQIPTIERKKPSSTPFVRKNATNDQLSEPIGYRIGCDNDCPSGCDNDCPSGCDNDCPSGCDNIIKDHLKEQNTRPDASVTEIVTEWNTGYFNLTGKTRMVSMQDVAYLQTMMKEYSLAPDEVRSYIRRLFTEWKSASRENKRFWPLRITALDGKMFARLDTELAADEEETAELMRMGGYEYTPAHLRKQA